MSTIKRAASGGKMSLLRPRELSTRAASEALGIPRRTLYDWAASGLVSPRFTDVKARARGGAFAWSLVDLLAARVIVRLRAAGVPGRAIRRAVKLVAKNSRDLAERILVVVKVDGKAEILDLVPAEKAVQLVSGKGQSWFLALAAEADEVQRLVDKHRAMRAPIRDGDRAKVVALAR